ncbi:hypothetical protein EDD16DRAFT_661597 [Pisolithus croceorrhizus]|nr:hypothetical protein EDD16DRAFT_661597 [Pisolithus croceorrhizus]KAI6164977.1 hypothetical protein EDD17DRAFT_321656 [Pisolithus thermaeus]
MWEGVSASFACTVVLSLLGYPIEGGFDSRPPPTLRDGTETEPASDTEILQCEAQNGQKRAGLAPSSSSRGRTSRHLVSSLVSLVRRRYTPEPSVSGSLGTIMEDEAGLRRYHSPYQDFFLPLDWWG